MKCKLYKAFIVPYFRYCSAVWHFCGARNRLKLENLNKRAIRIVLNEKSLHYQELLGDFDSTGLYSIRCQDMMKTVLRQSSLKRCQSTYVVLFKLQILNATYEDKGNLLSHTLTQPPMILIPSDTILQTCGTN